MSSREFLEVKTQPYISFDKMKVDHLPSFHQKKKKAKQTKKREKRRKGKKRNQMVPGNSIQLDWSLLKVVQRAIFSRMRTKSEYLKMY